MKSYEFEGKTAEEAINNASRKLNISAENLDFEIIEPGSAGIFGLVGTRSTKIKVTIQKGGGYDEEDFDDYSKIAEIDTLEDTDETADDNEGEQDQYFTIAKDALDNILGLIPVETTVTGNHFNGKVSLNIEGDTSGLLIGRKGKTLDALQYIVNKIANNVSDKKLKVIIDSENYRQRRIESLTQMALKIGEKAKKLKKPFSTNPLNPHDRRIVHLTLKNINELETRSRGEGLYKRVVVIPKR
ncbi:RNA-binding cell elongation regulator Jag/EloR [Thermodesulfobacteriota bacterium]